MTIKVCHVTSAHKRYDVRIFQKECISLSENGYDVTLIVNDEHATEELFGTTICSVKRKYSSRLQRILAIKSIFKMATDIDADIYHLHDPELLLIAKKLKKLGKKVIFDSHEFYYEQIKTKSYIPQAVRSMIAQCYYKYETNVMRKIDAVVGVKPLLVDGKEIDPFKFRCQRVVFIGNYPKKKNDLHINSKKTAEFKVCYAGGLTHERGITYLIDACYKVGCTLILAGNFSSKEYHEKLKQKESYQCVDYRGVCDRNEVYSIYNEASVGAATLLNVGQYYKMNDFATKVIEYFQMQLPVIISNYPYAVKMNNNYNFGICVDPQNIDDIAAALLKLKNNSELVSRLGENGYSLYKEQFNWENEEVKLLELYRELNVR